MFKGKQITKLRARPEGALGGMADGRERHGILRRRGDDRQRGSIHRREQWREHSNLRRSVGTVGEGPGRVEAGRTERAGRAGNGGRESRSEGGRKEVFVVIRRGELFFGKGVVTVVFLIFQFSLVNGNSKKKISGSAG